MEEKKRKQHYVWEHHLKAWATDGHVWCQLPNRPDPIRASTGSIGQGHDFYRLREMSEYDLHVIEGLISRMGEHLQPLARGWRPLFRLYHEAKRAYEATGQRDADVVQELDVGINNMEEDIHASVERAAIPLLTALREGNGSVLADDGTFVDFARFVGMQYMRTPGIMRRFIEAGGEPRGFNVEASLGLMRTIFAHNIGFNLFARRRTLRLTFLNAPVEREFITGDQPIVNARAAQLAADAEAIELEYYLPLTPRRALLLDFDHAGPTEEHRDLTADETTTYNRMIIAKSAQVYARTKEALVEALGA